MVSRLIAIVLAAASLGLLSCSAFAQSTDAPTAGVAAAPAAKHEAKPRKARVRKAAKVAPRPSPGTAAPPAAPISGGETEAASLERRRKAFFATKPDEAAPEAETPSAGVTLGGSGGISPGMGFRF